MAEDWIPMRCNLPDDPTVIAASDALGIDVDTIVGKLHRVWSWYDQHTRNGVAKNVTPERMNARVGCEKFLESFIREGWFSVTPEGLKMNKFSRWLSQGGKRRALNARRQATWRAKKRNANSNGTELPHNSTEHNSTVQKKRYKPMFVPPTLEEVAAFCKERGNSVDPQRFMDHYSSNGWRVGKNPMKDWRAAVGTWERNGNTFGGKNDGSRTSRGGSGTVHSPGAQLEGF